MERYDLIILGAGAAGLMAGVAAGQRGLRAAILDRNDRPGKKLLATGNGRCNLTHEHIDPAVYHGDVKPVLDVFNDRQLRAFFGGYGLATRADSAGRIYPESQQAATVLRFFTDTLEACHVPIFCDAKVKKIEKTIENYQLLCEDGRTFAADKLIVAFGGNAGRGFGTDGAAFQLLKPFGLWATDLHPALTGLTVDAPYQKNLKGVRREAVVTHLRNGETLSTTRGEVQFNDDSLSGIVIMDLSGDAEAGDTLCLDLIPDYDEQLLSALLLKRASLYPERPMGELLHFLLPKALADVIAKELNLPADPMKKIKLGHIAGAIESAKNFTYTVTGRKGHADAQVTRGGIPLDKVSLPSMEVLGQPGLYIVGEALDVDGPCGGYNLHWAFATGMAAATHAAGGSL